MFFHSILAMLMMLCCTAERVLAQTEPEKIDIDIRADNNNAWYGQAWIWALGLAALILIVVTFSKSKRVKKKI